MSTANLVSTLPPVLLAFITLLALLAIGALIWSMLPRRTRRDADIEHQIATLRQHADHDVAHRPRVRANGCHSAPGHIKAAPKATLPTGVPVPDAARFIDVPLPCGGGMCRQRADCADHYCPGRMSSTLTGTNQP